MQKVKSWTTIISSDLVRYCITSATGPFSLQSPSSNLLYIKIIHHPHSRITEPSIISLDDGHYYNLENTNSSLIDMNSGIGGGLVHPWAPFQVCADFEYTESAVKWLLNSKIINNQLKGIHNGSWCSNHHITLRSSHDMGKSLEAVQAYGIQVSVKTIQIIYLKYSITCYSKFDEGHVSGEFEGKTYSFTFPYWSPWKWLESIISDPDLAPLISWYPVQIFLIIHGKETRLYDEPNSGIAWWNAQVLLLYVDSISWPLLYSWNYPITRTRTLNASFHSFYGGIRVTLWSISRCILWYFEQHFCQVSSVGK